MVVARQQLAVNLRIRVFTRLSFGRQHVNFPLAIPYFFSTATELALANRVLDFFWEIAHRETFDGLTPSRSFSPRSASSSMISSTAIPASARLLTGCVRRCVHRQLALIRR
jgi:hypothetical protein